MYCCGECGSDDNVSYSDHYGKHLCMDCYNRWSEEEQRFEELSADDWDEWLTS